MTQKPVQVARPIPILILRPKKCPNRDRYWYHSPWYRCFRYDTDIPVCLCRIGMVIEIESSCRVNLLQCTVLRSISFHTISQQLRRSCDSTDGIYAFECHWRSKYDAYQCCGKIRSKIWLYSIVHAPKTVHALFFMRCIWRLLALWCSSEPKVTIHWGFQQKVRNPAIVCKVNTFIICQERFHNENRI